MLRVLMSVVGMNRGGLETFTMGLLRNIDRNKVCLDFLVSIDGDYDKEIIELGSRIYKIPFITKTGPFQYAKNLRSFFKDHPEYRIIHIQMDKFGGMVAREAAKSGIPVRIVHSHNTKNEGGILYKLVKNYYGRLIPHYATDLFACGEDAAKWMFKEDASKAVIVRNGVDLNKFKCRDNRDNNYLTIGNVGRFSTQKNHSFLLDIFSEVKKLKANSKLILAGTGKFLNEMKNKSKKLGIFESVEFLGVRPDVEEILTMCDVICMPSLFEGFPVTLVEVQAVGVPAVVSDTITKECAITEDVEFMSLRYSPMEWAEKLVGYKGLKRKDNSAVIEKAGFSIVSVTKEMQKFYLERIKEDQLHNNSSMKGFCYEQKI